MTMMQHNPRKNEEGFTKVIFSLEPDEDHPYLSEGIWARKVGPGLFRLENIPFFVSGVSYHDVVAASKRGGGLRFSRVGRRGGHSTYRVFVNEEIDPASEPVRKGKARLKSLGCEFEVGGRRWFAADVAPHADIYAVYDALEELENAGIWTFEEGHCAHKV